MPGDPHAAHSPMRRDRTRPALWYATCKGDGKEIGQLIIIASCCAVTGRREGVNGAWKSEAMVLFGLPPISSKGAHHDRKIDRNPTLAAQSGIADPIRSLLPKLLRARHGLFTVVGAYTDKTCGSLAKYSDWNRSPTPPISSIGWPGCKGRSSRIDRGQNPGTSPTTVARRTGGVGHGFFVRVSGEGSRRSDHGSLDEPSTRAGRRRDLG